MSKFVEMLPGIPIVESPLFNVLIDEMPWTPEERAVAIALNRDGYAVIEFPDAELDLRIERIRRNLAPRYNVDLEDPNSIKTRGNQRLQDAWSFDDDVRAIATNEKIVALLTKLYGREAFPFQTLNFPVGTQQHVHSDSVHFSSIPERFMCGVWLAMEDIDETAGPLLYYPGTHKWPIISNVMIENRRFGDHSRHAQEPYEQVWRAMVDANRIEPEIFRPRKGQALIWAANLLHGGSLQSDSTKTRWSQVTHYYFKDCAYYTPAFSEEPLGKLDLRSIQNISSGEIEPNRVLGETLSVRVPEIRKSPSIFRRLLKGRSATEKSDLPEDFSAEVYLQLNPDVAAAGETAQEHYVKHGRREGRAYRP